MRKRVLSLVLVLCLVLSLLPFGAAAADPESVLQKLKGDCANQVVEQEGAALPYTFTASEPYLDTSWGDDEFSTGYTITNNGEGTAENVGLLLYDGDGNIIKTERASAGPDEDAVLRPGEQLNRYIWLYSIYESSLYPSGIELGQTLYWRLYAVEGDTQYLSEEHSFVVSVEGSRFAEYFTAPEPTSDPAGGTVPACLTYSISNGEAIITKCDESADGALVIPAEIEGCPVTTIDEAAFWNCSSLTSVTIPESVTSILPFEFSGCDSLQEILAAENNRFYSSLDGVLFNQARTEMVAFPPGKNIQNYVIPESVTSIAMGAFVSCKGLTDVTIPESVRSIGSQAFRDCFGLTEVTLPKHIKSISDGAFIYCSGLTSVTIPQSVTSIQNGAFLGCGSLKDVWYGGTEAQWNAIAIDENNDALQNAVIHFTEHPAPEYLTYVISNGEVTITGCDPSAEGTLVIPAEIEGCPVTKIESGAFADCSALEAFTVADDNPSFCSVEGVLFNKDQTELIAHPAAGPKYGYTVPDTVKVIGDYAFSGCGKLWSITLPDGLETMGKNAFQNCTQLREITIPQSVTEINHGLFSGCSWLYRITLPASLTTIKSDAFAGCDVFREVRFGGTQAQWNAVAIEQPNAALENAEINFSANPACPDLTYRIHNGEVTITGINQMFEGDVVLPAEIEGFPVTTIGNGAFCECWNITGVTIPEGVTSIEADAFNTANSLEWVSIPSTVTSIGDGAFRNCEMLKDVTLPENLTSLGRNAFRSCKSLTSIRVPDGVTEIQTATFLGDDVLTDVTLPDSLTSIGAYAFEYCTALEAITLPEGLETIGSCAFGQCTALREIALPESLKTIGGAAFIGCGSLTGVAIPAGVETIEEAAFAGCGNLAAVTVASENANYCDVDGVLFNRELTVLLTYPAGKSGSEYAVPDTVTSIGESAFSGCTQLAAIQLPTGLKTIGDSTFSGCSGLTDLALPRSLTNIGMYAFNNCTALTDVTIPNRVASIGFGAFMGCSGLQSAALPTSLTKIENNLFSDCAGLESIIIPNHVTTIGQYAFQNCSSLASVTIPASVTTMEYGAFDGCAALKDLYYTGTPEQWSSVSIYSCNDAVYAASVHYIDPIPDPVPECLTYEISNGEVTITKCDPSTEGALVIPAEIEGCPVTAIGEYAFHSCDAISGVVLPEGLTNIGHGAFHYCRALTNVSMPESLKSIDNLAFYCCDSLAEITIPESVVSIGDSAFSSCRSLTDISLPAGLEHLGEGAFSDCSSLGTIRIDETNEHYRVVEDVLFNNAQTELITFPAGKDTTVYEVPDGVTSIANEAFFGCRQLTSVVLPDGLTSIGFSAFSSCSAMTEINIPESVTSISDYAFFDCSSLESIVIPEGITRIGSEIFAYCYKLTSVSIPQSVQYIDACAFDDCGLTDVWFDGTQAQWNAITIGERNDSLLNAEIHFTEIPVPACLTYEIANGEVTITGCDPIAEGELVIPAEIEGCPVTAIGDNAFANCAALTSITIPEGVISIGSFAFCECRALREIVLPESLCTMGDYVFDSCVSLTEVSMPDSVCTVGHSTFVSCESLESVRLSAHIPSITPEMFSSCVSLKSLEIPEGINAIGGAAFSGCISLESLSIPASLREIAAGPTFSSCGKLAEFRVAEENPAFTTAEGSLVTKDGEKLIRLAAVKTDDPTLPDGLRTIGTGSVSNYRGLLSLRIPEGVTTLEDDAISFCEDLVELYLPSTLTEIGDYAILACPALETVFFNGTRAQWNEVEIGEQDEAFTQASVSFTANPAAPCLIYEIQDGHAAIIGCDHSAEGHLVIPDALEGCPVTVIDIAAFGGCKALTGITVPNSVTVIGPMAFVDCSALTEINLPENLKTIPEAAFSMCSSLTEIRIPASVTRIGASAFHNLNLTDVWFDGTQAQWDAIEIGKNNDSLNTATIHCTEPETLPEIVQQPANQTVAEGETAVFTVEAEGSNLQYQWQFKSAKSSSWSKSGMTGAKTARLQVPATAARNGQQYRCVITNGAGSVTSEAATLKVVSKPAITTQPQSVTANVGDTVQFTVQATGTDLTYQWQYKTTGSSKWSNSTMTGAKTATMSVPVTAGRNGYQYRCVITNAAGSVTSEAATLKAISKPAITTQPQSVTANVGDTVQFTVKATGSNLTYQWQYKPASSSTWSNSTTTDAKTATLSVSATTARNGHQYRCIVKNSAGSVTSSAAKLTVLSKPAITTQPQSVSAKVGDTVQFTVKATGRNLTYQWQYKPASSSTWSNSTSSDAKTATLRVSVTAARNGHQYRCIVKNSAGSVTSSAAKLIVLSEPTIKTQPQSITANAGDTVQFTVKAAGGNLTYQWQYKTAGSSTWHNSTMTGARTAAMTVPVTAARNGYQYRCIVTNDLGSVTSSAAKLTVK